MLNLILTKYRKHYDNGRGDRQHAIIIKYEKEYFLRFFRDPLDTPDDTGASDTGGLGTFTMSPYSLACKPFSTKNY